MKYSETEFILAKNIVQTLQKRLEMLKKLHETKNNLLKITPTGTLRISNNRGTPQYYLRTNPKDTRGKYIKAKDKELALRLAQKDYDKSVINGARKEIQLLNYTLTAYKRLEKQNHIVEKIIENLKPLRQALITPIRLSDQEYAQKWQAVKYPHKDFPNDFPEYYTIRGDRVRSKSEILIADTLFRHNIPYRYEYPLTLKKRAGEPITLFPDFICLDLRTRNEVYWEHFGMMDNPDYIEQLVRKMHLYQSNGIISGQKLITTMETSTFPINSKQIEQIIRQYFA